MNEIRLFLHELESMDEYSSTIPTGTVMWKMWRRRSCSNGAGRLLGIEWFVGQYVPDDKYGRPLPKSRIGIRWFKVVLRQEPVPPIYRAPDWSNYQRYRKEVAEERKQRCAK
jgi:hypothetical protein